MTNAVLLERRVDPEPGFMNLSVLGSNLVVPSVELSARQYSLDGAVTSVEPYVSAIERSAMDMALALGQEALLEGNRPIGAVLIYHGPGLTWGAKTIDTTRPRLKQHAELRAYDMSDGVLEDDLSDCTLVTTAEPCVTCTGPYAEGRIGKIILAAPRKDIRFVTGDMRERGLNMHDLLTDGKTNTIVVSGFEAKASLSNFAMYARLHKKGLYSKK